MLTMPREILWDGDRMVQRPLKELEQLRGKKKEIRRECSVQEKAGTPDVILPEGRCSFEIEAQAEGDFWIELSNEAGDRVLFQGDSREYVLDRGGMSYVYAERFGTVRYAQRLEKRQSLRVFADRSSLEIFADGGKTVFTTRVFLEGQITLRVRGLEGTMYFLNGIEMDRSARHLTGVKDIEK